jgi:hypothetical protein
LKKYKAPSLTLKHSYSDFRDYSPEIRSDSTYFKENRVSLEYTHIISSRTRLFGKYEKTIQTQVDIPDGTRDFHIKGEILSAGLTHHFEGMTVRGLFDYNTFEYDKEGSFNLADTEYGFSGYLIAFKELEEHYLSASFGRELYIGINQDEDLSKPAGLNVYTVANDYSYSDNFSLLGSFSVFQFDTPKVSYRKEYLIRPKYRLPFYEKIRLEYQYRYYTNPKEKVLSTFVSFLDSFKNGLKYRFELELRYNSLQDSLENIYSVFFSYNIGENLELVLDASLGVEGHKDEDVSRSIQTYLTWRF